MSQTTYNTEPAKGVEGAPVDSTLSRNSSFYAEGQINVGYAVTRGTDPEKQMIPFAGGDFDGIAMFDITNSINDATSLATIADKESFTVREKGRTWVHVDGAVAVNDAAYVLVAGDVGRFTATVGANVAVPNGKFVTATAGAGLAILEVS